MPTHQRPSAIEGSDEPKRGEILIYQDKEKKATLEVRLEAETVWLSQAQIAQLFGTQRPAITKHLRNIFKSRELDPKSVRSILEHTASDGKVYNTQFYNLDAIISLGYRINSNRATQFRIWATGVLRNHIIKGVTVNQKRIQELKGKQLDEFGEALALLVSAKQKALTKDETAGLLEVITDYANTWLLLQKYDEETLETDRVHKRVSYTLTFADARAGIAELKEELLRKKEAGELFGLERGHGIEAILGNLNQTFGGQDLYPSIEEKASHLLNGGSIELKADPAGVSSGVVATPTNLGQKTATIHPLNSERLPSAQISSKPKAAALFGGILHEHLNRRSQSRARLLR